MKIKLGLFAFLVLGCVPFGARAAVVFSEIQYDPQGTDTKHEWIEIHNTTESSVDISKYKFNDGSSATNHALNAPPLNGGVGTLVLAPNAYAVIADDAATFLSDVPGYAGTVIDSSFALVNTQSTLQLLSCPQTCTAVDTVSYSVDQGASNDGKTLQRTDGGPWVAGTPTPGQGYVESTTQNDPPAPVGSDTTASTATSTEVVVGQSAGVGGAATTASSASSSTPKKAATSTTAALSIPSSILAGVAFPVKVSATIPGGAPAQSGVFHVAFGDGTEAFLTTTTLVEHTYAYPGTYVVTLQYRTNVYAAEAAPDATARVTLEVPAPQVAISHAVDGAVTLKNTGAKEVDLSRWSVRSAGAVKDFRMPEGTILLAKKAISIPLSEIPASTSDLTLMLPSGTVTSTSFVPPVPLVVKGDTHVSEKEELLPQAKAMLYAKIPTDEQLEAVNVVASVLVVLGLSILLVRALLASPEDRKGLDG